ncbi:hypothetical protein TVAG_454150 [Trichomonas vaginalis G3]|uniref:Uncharacterized protein n=1 Tax=Trichomonas vaginalis (strain ATCC PRA-98 / G3) TaxID=412133 RepID=A2DPZ1_TRIV3|nr:hypothetical protein TVAGG3_0552670 [Trichomonas vaginalis G3]EAY17587.1 hypothetical protein TVAG_454150 [Trichomonas vaginalis G3]KAI5520631.1 hypothetical protein TVAGG3_0552670 [Trichomonas vaginalis G3]|eukprot:XP_001329722.1 hypothetical protein [Trichomonas vaginalis G3]
MKKIINKTKMRQKWIKLAKDNIRTNRIETYRKSFRLALLFDILQERTIRISFKKWHATYMWKMFTRNLLQKQFKKQCNVILDHQKKENKKVLQKKWQNLTNLITKQAKCDNIIEGLSLLQNKNLLLDHFTEWKEKSQTAIDRNHEQSDKWKSLVDKYTKFERLEEFKYQRERLDLQNNWIDLAQLLTRNNLIHTCIKEKSRIFWEQFTDDMLYFERKHQVQAAATRLKLLRKWRQYREILSKIQFHKEVQHQMKRSLLEDQFNQMVRKNTLFNRQKMLLEAKDELDCEREREKLVQKRNNYFLLWKEKTIMSQKCHEVAKIMFEEKYDKIYQTIVENAARTIQNWFRKANEERKIRKQIKTKYFRLWRNLPRKLIKNFVVFPQASLRVKKLPIKFDILPNFVSIPKPNVSLRFVNDKLTVLDKQSQRIVETVTKTAANQISLKIPNFTNRDKLKPLFAVSKRGIDKRIEQKINEKKCQIISQEIDFDFTNIFDKFDLQKPLQFITPFPKIKNLDKRLLNRISRLAAIKELKKPDFSFINDFINVNHLSNKMSVESNMPSNKRQRRRSLLAVNNHIKNLMKIDKNDLTVKTVEPFTIFGKQRFIPFVDQQYEICQTVLPKIDTLFSDLISENPIERFTKRPNINYSLPQNLVEEMTNSVDFDTSIFTKIFPKSVKNIENYVDFNINDLHENDIKDVQNQISLDLDVNFGINLDIMFLKNFTPKIKIPYFYTNYLFDLDLEELEQTNNSLSSLQPRSSPLIEKKVEEIEDKIDITLREDYFVNLKPITFIHEEHQIQNYDENDLIDLNELSLSEVKSNIHMKEFEQKPYPSFIKDLSGVEYDFTNPEFSIENKNSLFNLTKVSEPELTVEERLIKKVLDDVIIREDFVVPTEPINCLEDFKKIELVQTNSDKIIEEDFLFDYDFSRIPNIIVPKQQEIGFAKETVPSILDDSNDVKYKLKLSLEIEQNKFNLMNFQKDYDDFDVLDDAENVQVDIQTNFDDLELNNTLQFYEKSYISLNRADSVSFVPKLSNFTPDLKGKISPLLSLTNNPRLEHLKQRAGNTINSQKNICNIDLMIPDILPNYNLQNFVLQKINEQETEFSFEFPDFNHLSLSRNNLINYEREEVPFETTDYEINDLDLQEIIFDRNSLLSISSDNKIEKFEKEAEEISEKDEVLEDILEILHIPNIKTNNLLPNYEKEFYEYQSTDYEIPEISFDDLEFVDLSVLQNLTISQIPLTFSEEVKYDDNLRCEIEIDTMKPIKDFSPIVLSEKNEKDAKEISSKIFVNLHIPDLSKKYSIFNFEREQINEQNAEEYDVDLDLQEIKINNTLLHLTKSYKPKQKISFIKYDTDLCLDLSKNKFSLDNLGPIPKSAKIEKESKVISNMINFDFIIPNLFDKKSYVNFTNFGKEEKDFYQYTNVDFDFDFNSLQICHVSSLLNMKKCKLPKINVSFIIPDDFQLDFTSIPMISSLFVLENLTPIQKSDKIEKDVKEICQNQKLSKSITDKLFIPNLFNRSNFDSFSNEKAPEQTTNYNFQEELNDLVHFRTNIFDFRKEMIPLSLANEVFVNYDFANEDISKLDFTSLFNFQPKPLIQKFINDSLEISKNYQPILSIPLFDIKKLTISGPVRPNINQEFINSTSKSVYDDFDFDLQKLDSSLLLKPLDNAVLFQGEFNLPEELIPNNYLRSINQLIVPPMKTKILEHFIFEEIPEYEVKVENHEIIPDLQEIKKVSIYPLNALVPRKPRPSTIREQFILTRNFVTLLSRDLTMDDLEKKLNIFDTNLRPERIPTKLADEISEMIDVKLILPKLEFIMPFNSFDKPSIKEFEEIYDTNDIFDINFDVSNDLELTSTSALVDFNLSDVKMTEEIAEEFSNDFILDLSLFDLKFDTLASLNSIPKKEDPDLSNLLNSMTVSDHLVIPSEIFSKPKFEISKVTKPETAKFADEIFPMEIKFTSPQLSILLSENNFLQNLSKISIPPPKVDLDEIDFDLDENELEFVEVNHLKNLNKDSVSIFSKRDMKLRKKMNHLRGNLMEDIDDFFNNVILKKSIETLKDITSNSDTQLVVDEIDDNLEDMIYDITDSFVFNMFEKIEFFEPEKPSNSVKFDEEIVQPKKEKNIGEEIGNDILDTVSIICSRIAIQSAMKINFPFTEITIKQEEDPVKEYLEEDFDLYLEGMVGDIVIQSMITAIDSSLGSIVKPPTIPHIRWVLPDWWDPYAEHTTFTDDYSLDNIEKLDKDDVNSIDEIENNSFEEEFEIIEKPTKLQKHDSLEEIDEKKHVTWNLPDWWNPNEEKPTFSEEYSDLDFNNIEIDQENLISSPKPHVKWILPDWWDPNKKKDVNDDDEYSQEFFEAMERIKELSKQRRNQPRMRLSLPPPPIDLLEEDFYEMEKQKEKKKKKHHKHHRKSDSLPTPPKEFLENESFEMAPAPPLPDNILDQSNPSVDLDIISAFVEDSLIDETKRVGTGIVFNALNSIKNLKSESSDIDPFNVSDL